MYICNQGFSYFPEGGARLNLGTKHFNHQNRENSIQPFKMD